MADEYNYKLYSPELDYSMNDYSGLGDLYNKPDFVSRQPNQFSGGFYETPTNQPSFTRAYDPTDYTNFGATSPQFLNQTSGSFPASYQMPESFTPRQPTEYSGGEYEVDPATGEPRKTTGLMDTFRNFSMPQVSQGQADMFKGLAGLYSAYQGRNQAAQLRAAAQQQDPFGAQRGQYQQLLSQSYANPNAFTSTPEARMQQDALRQQLERLDAKSGRRSQYGARAVQLAQAQAKQLADYRAGLQQAAGSGISPSGAGLLQSQAAQAEMTAGGAPFQALSDIFTGQSPQYRAQAAENQKLKDSIALLSK